MLDTSIASRPVSHASRTALRESKKAPPTLATSGQMCSELFARSCPNGSLVRMFRALTESTWHSTECSLIWKVQATRQSRLKFQLAPSMRRTSESACSLWPTATANSTTGAGTSGREGGLNLQTAAAMWPTVRASDHKSGKSNVTHNSRPLAEVATWATVRSSDGQKGGPNMRGSKGDQPLPSQAFQAATWTTADGQARNGSTAPTEKGGALAPEFVGWLMGFPSGWCEVTTTDAPTKAPSGRHKLPDDPKFCMRCGDQFYRSQRPSKAWEDRTAFAKRKYCSLSCANSHGAVTTAGHRARAIKLRGQQCEACGLRSKLQAHHVNGDITNNTPANIQTLCEHCHGFWHNMLARNGMPIAGRMPPLYRFSLEMSQSASIKLEPTATPCCPKSSSASRKPSLQATRVR